MRNKKGTGMKMNCSLSLVQKVALMQWLQANKQAATTHTIPQLTSAAAAELGFMISVSTVGDMRNAIYPELKVTKKISKLAELEQRIIALEQRLC